MMKIINKIRSLLSQNYNFIFLLRLHPENYLKSADSNKLLTSDRVFAKVCTQMVIKGMAFDEVNAFCRVY